MTSHFIWYINSMNLKVCNVSNYQSNSHTDRHIQQMTIYACAMNVVVQSLESFSQVGCHCCCIMIIPMHVLVLGDGFRFSSHINSIFDPSVTDTRTTHLKALNLSWRNGEVDHSHKLLL